MKKLRLLLTATLIVFLFTACNKILFSDTQAKKAIISYSPEAIITECTYHSETNMYEIEFKTSHNIYVGYVNAATGNVDSVTVKEEIQPEDNSVFTPEEPEEETFISADTALSIALKSSGTSGTAVLVKNELNHNNKTFTCIFRAGNREYTYIIDAVTGEIISFETEIDS